jgi:outer membrane immunogenic protein
VKKFFVTISAITALGCASAANAADLPTKAPAPLVMAPVYNWSGWYVGLNAGAAFGHAHDTTTTVFSPTGYFATTSPGAIAIAGDQTMNNTGFTGGIQLGYNWQMNNTVFGIETDFGYMGLRASTAASGVYPCCAPTGFTVNQSAKTDWLWTLRPRVGWASNNWLLYVTGGLAVTQIKGDFLFTDTFATANESASISQTKAGWALGGGVEYGILGGPWRVKVEYLHVDFGSVSTTSTNLTAFTPRIAFPTNVYTHSIKLSDDIVRVGVNYRL